MSKDNAPSPRREHSSAASANVKFFQGRAITRSSRLRIDQENLIARALPTCGSEVGNIDSRQLSSEITNSEELDSLPNPVGIVEAADLSAISVSNLVDLIGKTKTTDRKPFRITHVPLDNVCLVGEQTGRIKWIQPSGPRSSGQGVDDEEQGLISAETTASGGALIRITLLASGFIIGPSGISVREICKQTGADIKSWTDKRHSIRPTRMFVIEGHSRAVTLALGIICDAIDRYKELCEGAYCGQFVSRIQPVCGINFCYQPPPRSAVPYAAALRGHAPRSRLTGDNGNEMLTPENAPTSQPVILPDFKANPSVKGKPVWKGHNKKQPASQVRSCSSGFHDKETQPTADGPSYSFILQKGLTHPRPDPPRQDNIWPQVPVGYVLVPPNVLVPLDVLKQMSHFEDSQQIAQPGQWGIPASYGLGVTGGRPMPDTGPHLQGHGAQGFSPPPGLFMPNTGSYLNSCGAVAPGHLPALTQTDSCPWVHGPHPFLVPGVTSTASASNGSL